jgi:glycosyltransferase involved in cell wall biosynthesis
MRFHVVSLPHTQTTLDFTACAFTEKVRKFAIMMKSLGHTVYVYSGDKNEAPCDEHVQCFTEKERLAACNGGHYTMASFDDSKPHWVKFNQTVIKELRNRLEERDFICVIGGYSHRSIAYAYPNHMTVEFGIGYPGTFAKYRVFESYAWMHSIYGAEAKNPAAADGRFYDAVIPAYIDIAQFPFVQEPSDYYLFMGRLIERKGFNIAVEACRKVGARLLIAGQGMPPSYGEYVGVVGAEKRAELFGNAIASFAPTIYVEPFGTVVIESQACGTPAITTDWGAFTETVTNGFNGYRCRTLKDFIETMEKAKSLDRKKIREYAVAHYGLDAVALRYDEYFKRLSTLWEDGWYSD